MNKKYPHFLLFSLEFLHFLIFQTQYPAPPNTKQHHNMKSNPNTECLAKKIPIPSTFLVSLTSPSLSFSHRLTHTQISIHNFQ